LKKGGGRSTGKREKLEKNNMERSAREQNRNLKRKSDGGKGPTKGRDGERSTGEEGKLGRESQQKKQLSVDEKGKKS